MARRYFRTLGVYAAQGVVGWIAVESIKVAVAPDQPYRSIVLLAIWPLVIIAGTIVSVVWIWRAPDEPLNQSIPERAPWQLALAKLHDQGMELLDDLRAHQMSVANDGTREALTMRYGNWDRECQRIVESSPGFHPGDWGHFEGNDGRMNLDADERFPPWVGDMALNVDRRLRKLRRYGSGEPIARWG
jgi:hypothetical protein